MSTSALEKIELAVEDGTKMNVYVARPTGAARTKRGILVFQEAFGVNGHIQSIATRFAALGFTAVAPELYHRTGTGVDLKYGDMDAVKPHASAVTVETLQADARAAYGWLKNQDGIGENIASVGYCMGGRVSYVTNATLPLRAAISYYGGGIAQNLLGLAGKQHAPILMFWGGLDKNITLEHTRAVADALAAAGKVHEQVTFSFADHGFLCDARASYNVDAARQAWALQAEFLHVRFGDPQ